MRLLPALLLAACGTNTDAKDVETDSTDSTADEESDTPAVPFACDVPATDAEIEAALDANVLRWPYLSSVTHETATISWGMAPSATASLGWGLDDTLGTEATPETTAIDPLVEPLVMHEAKLTGLLPDRDYCYQLVDDQGAALSSQLSFHTAPSPDSKEPVTFLVLGDYGGGGQPAQDVLDVIMTHVDEIDFWITAGDNAYNSGTWQEWEDNIFRFYRHLLRRVSYWPTPGNHDYGGPNQLTPMLTAFDLPKNAIRDIDKERYYSFDWGPAHFVMGDSQLAVKQIQPVETAIDDMGVWMRKDLEDSKDRPWNIAVWHHPTYMTTPSRSADFFVLANLVPIIENAGVPLQIAGHNHVYERFSNMKDGEKVDKGGTTYVITGAGGKSLYDIGPDDPRAALAESSHSAYHFMLITVDECTLTARAIGLDDEELDRFELTRCE